MKKLLFISLVLFCIFSCSDDTLIPQDEIVGNTQVEVSDSENPTIEDDIYKALENSTNFNLMISILTDDNLDNDVLITKTVIDNIDRDLAHLNLESIPIESYFNVVERKLNERIPVGEDLHTLRHECCSQALKRLARCVRNAQLFSGAIFSGGTTIGIIVLLVSEGALAPAVYSGWGKFTASQLLAFSGKMISCSNNYNWDVSQCPCPCSPR